MSFLNQLAGQAMSALGKPGADGETSAGLLASVMYLVNQHGGLPGLLQKFQESGLGDQVASWIGSGANAPVSGDQIKDALGADTITQIAEKAGVAPDAASGGLAALLPQLIDMLTPNGQVPEGNDLVSQGLNMLKGKLFA
ncbi:MAG: DUF937 domain-containing protein [Janthinobacterium lividum]|nr:DUF937 domain-containing protein [Janthinobacterium lividum]